MTDFLIGRHYPLFSCLIGFLPVCERKLGRLIFPLGFFPMCCSTANVPSGGNFLLHTTLKTACCLLRVPRTLLFAWCNPHFPSNLPVHPPVLWKVFPFNSHNAGGSESIPKCLVSSCWKVFLNLLTFLGSVDHIR